MKTSKQIFKLIFIMTFVLVITSGLTAFDAKSASHVSEKSVFTYAGPDREQKLVERARTEGRLTWYTSLAGRIVTAVAKAFEAKYPFIEVGVYRASHSKIFQRVIQESRANKNVVDVLETTPGATLALKDRELITPYFSPSVANLPDDYQMKASGNTVWAAADRVSYVGFTYNKSKLSSSYEPKTLNDLLKPELKNKLGIASSTTGVRWIGCVLNTFGEQNGRKFLKELKKQNVKMYAISGGALMDLIAAGEIAASMTTYGEHAAQAKAKGVPLEWIPIEGGSLVNIGQVYVAKHAPNPNAAVLFADFLLGKDGAEVLKKNKYMPASESRGVAFKAWSPEAGVDSSKKYIEKLNKWKELLNETFE